MANTFVAIATTTVGSGGASNIEFTSIPGTYTDLVVLVSARTNRAVYNDSIKLTFNGNTSSYSNRGLGGAGDVVFSFTNAGSASVEDVNFLPGSPATASTFGNGSIYIPNYAGSNNKSLSGDSVGENNATNAGALLNAGLWSNTAAITSITLAPLNGTLFSQYSTATLYGIKNTV